MSKEKLSNVLESIEGKLSDGQDLTEAVDKVLDDIVSFVQNDYKANMDIDKVLGKSFTKRDIKSPKVRKKVLAIIEKALAKWKPNAGAKDKIITALLYEKLIQKHL